MRYKQGDLVVFNYSGTNQVGLVTNVRTKKGTSTYDIRSEKGSCHLMVPVNNSKADIWINSKITQIWTGTGGDNNMWVDRSLGHTIANYSPELELNEFHFEKNNDFVFKTIGPRSY